MLLTLSWEVEHFIQMRNILGGFNLKDQANTVSLFQDILNKVFVGAKMKYFLKYKLLKVQEILSSTVLPLIYVCSGCFVFV